MVERRVEGEKHGRSRAAGDTLLIKFFRTAACQDVASHEQVGVRMSALVKQGENPVDEFEEVPH